MSEPTSSEPAAHDREVDVVVIGAGPAGEQLVVSLADSGLDVVVVEAHLVGGECANYGCMPSKALLRPGQVRAEARRTAGVDGGPPLDLPAVLERRDGTTDEWDDERKVAALSRRGAAVLRGHARLVGEREVLVDPLPADPPAGTAERGADGEHLPRTVRAHATPVTKALRLRARVGVVLATGAAAATPPIDGLDAVGAWDNREATGTEHVPASMIVLGAGILGAELSQAWSTLGVRVTTVENGELPLDGEEPAARRAVADGLRAAGVDLRLGAKATSAPREGDEVVLRVEGEDGTTEDVRAEVLLVAIGRVARSAGLGLEALGIEPGAGGVLATGHDLSVPGHPWLSVLGDLGGRAQLTHQARRQARVLARRLQGDESAVMVDDDVETGGTPRVVFTEPNVAAVGITLETARERGLDAVAIDADAQKVAGGVFYARGTESPCRFVVDRGTGTLVGATFVGAETADWLHAATIAIVGRVPVATLERAVPAFPTRSEVWLRLTEAAVAAASADD